MAVGNHRVQTSSQRCKSQHQTESLFDALLDRYVDCRVIHFDVASRRMLINVPVEAEYVIEFFPRDPSRLIFDSFRISKSFHALRKLTKSLKKEVNLAADRFLTTTNDVSQNLGHFEKRSKPMWGMLPIEIKRGLKLVENFAMIVDSEPKKYFSKTLSMKSLSKRRILIVLNALKTLLYNFPNKRDIMKNVSFL